jgi:hypothetical protein
LNKYLFILILNECHIESFGDAQDKLKVEMYIKKTSTTLSLTERNLNNNGLSRIVYLVTLSGDEMWFSTKFILSYVEGLSLTLLKLFLYQQAVNCKLIRFESE